MSEETRDEQILNAENEKMNNIKTAIKKFKNKDNKFLFPVAKTTNPAASIYEIYFHAYVAKKMGYKVVMLTDGDDYEKPYWIEDELVNIEHMSMSNNKLKVGPQDILVIPEIYSNVMEQTKNLPCIRIGLLQSIDYMVNSLVPATDWSSFGIKNIITTSENLKNFIIEFYGKQYNIKTYNVGIPSYFKYNGESKIPTITVVGRNPNEISKLIKLFYSKYPQFSWVTFDTMITDSKPPRALTRKEYAERLRKNFAAVWVDRISSFGTLPLEAMRSNTIPIALVPDVTPEYIIDKDENGVTNYIENSGVWTNDFYALPILIGDTITKFLDDSISDEVYDKMQKIAEPYTQERSESQLIEIYESFINERIDMLEKALDDFDKKINETEKV